MCFYCLYKFGLKTSHSQRKWARYDQKCLLVFMYSTRHFCQILMKPEYSSRFSENTQISTSMKIRPVGAELIHEERRTDRQIWPSFSQFFERDWKDQFVQRSYKRQAFLYMSENNWDTAHRKVNTIHTRLL
jgi:hypothetical protein